MLHTDTAIPMNNPPYPPSLHTQRRSSRSRSISSSLTAKRTASPGPLHGLETPPSNNRPTSHPHDRGGSDVSISDGMGNLNRWSQSTTSSTGTLNAAQGHSNGSLWARRNPSASSASGASREELSPRAVSLGRVSPASSPNPQRRRDAALEKPLPPAIPPLSFTQIPLTAESPNGSEALLTANSFTPSTTGLLTPLSYSASDYFGSSSSLNSDATKREAPPSTTDRPRELSAGHSRYSTQQAMQHQRSPSSDVTSPGEPAQKRPRSKDPREKDKKTMLSKALEKANTAVLLDNAMNYEGAFNAYEDACRLLQYVMDRTSGAEDKRKLDAIRDTYASRIEELLQLQPSTQSPVQGKQLPPRPMSDESLEYSSPPLQIADALSPARSIPVIETATVTKNGGLSINNQLPRNSFLTDAIREVEGANSGGFLGPLWEKERSKFSERSSLGDSILGDNTASDNDMDKTIMPRPLAPRITPSPNAGDQSPVQGEESPAKAIQAAEVHELPASGVDPVSWLDTIDESGSSDTSSVRSRSSQLGVHRKPVPAVEGESELAFDAAFDAAVEAAYEDGLEPNQSYGSGFAELDATDKHPSKFAATEIPPPLPNQSYQAPMYEQDELDEEAEEERLLDDITSDYLDQGFDFDMQSKSALPRQSDSSAYSRSTWQSSNVSNRTTAGTSLSTVAERVLPRLPTKETQHSPSQSDAVYPVSIAPSVTESLALPADSTTGTGDRRGSTGQNLNFKNLKIETTAKHANLRQTVPESQDLGAHDTEVSGSNKPMPEIPSLPQTSSTLISPPNILSAASDVATAFSYDSSAPPDSADLLNGQPSPKNRLFGRKKKSLLSLRDHGASMLEEPVPALPLTPLSGSFMPNTTTADVPIASRRTTNITPSAGSIPAMHDGSASGGSHLFDTSLASTSLPSSPRSHISDPAPSLEPCPEPHLLRPFWLLRCIASTITHPKGGFLTTRLFVPHEVWLNRSVKLKSVEEKIANCDLLTAALGRLSSVNTYDADAVLEELQNFEEVMERVQATLIKRLGSEVGVQGVGALFKDATTVDGPSTGADGSTRESGPKTNSGKSYLSGWRKLRSKNTSFGGASGPAASGRVEKEGPLMATIPMTSFVSVDSNGRPKIDLTHDIAADGPHRDYMISLARLCEAAQVLGTSHPLDSLIND